MFVGGCALSSSMFRIYLEKVVIVELEQKARESLD
jgi:hypothetical protein